MVLLSISSCWWHAVNLRFFRSTAESESEVPVRRPSISFLVPCCNSGLYIRYYFFASMEKGGTEMSFSWIQDTDEQIPPQAKVKRKVKHKKMEFVGWGSKPLIYFLESNGKDCSKQLSQFDVSTVIREYISRHNLIDPLKKKKIVCDEWLFSLFGKKKVPRIRVHDLLKEHFAENHDLSDDDLLYSSDEDEAVRTSSKRNRKVMYEKKKVTETSKSCFVAIVPDNIKLLFLKRSLVQELMKNTETFEGKVVGSYVRVKSDPNDYSHKHSHQLLPVTGTSERSDVGEILLQLANVIKPISIRLLSEENFSEDECEYLRQRVKDGLIRRPTVVEFEQKARILHEDITKHWLEKELSLLRNLKDRANEKGWRREKFEYSERIQLLETPTEKARLLHEVPKVIADELELDPTLTEPIKNATQEISTSPKSISDEIEPGSTLQAPINNAKQGIISSPTSIISGSSINSTDSGANQPISSLYADAEGSIVAPIPSQDNTNEFPVDRKSKVTSVNGITSTEWSNGLLDAFATHKLQNKMEVKLASVVQQQNGLFMPKRNGNSIGMQVPWCGGTNAFETYRLQKVTEVKQASVLQQPNGLRLPTMNENSNVKQVAWCGGTNAFENESQKTIEVTPANVVRQQNMLTMNEKSIGMQVPWCGGTNNFATYKPQKIMEVKPASILQHRNRLFTPTINDNSNGMQVPWDGRTNNSSKVEEKKVTQVIELSDDDDDDEEDHGDKEDIKEEGFQFRILENRESKIWYYLDPLGRAQGPVTMSDLKIWNDAHYFKPDFKVWKRDQNPGQAVLLTDLLRDMF